MIWKLLFIGFILRNNRTNKILLLNSMPRNEVSKRQRSNSEDINSINDVIICNKNTSTNSNTPSVFEWRCNDRASCNMGDGSYQKWLNSLKMK